MWGLRIEYPPILWCPFPQPWLVLSCTGTYQYYADYSRRGESAQSYTSFSAQFSLFPYSVLQILASLMSMNSQLCLNSESLTYSTWLHSLWGLAQRLSQDSKLARVLNSPYLFLSLWDTILLWLMSLIMSIIISYNLYNFLNNFRWKDKSSHCYSIFQEAKFSDRSFFFKLWFLSLV